MAPADPGRVERLAAHALVAAKGDSFVDAIFSGKGKAASANRLAPPGKGRTKARAHLR